MAGAAIPCPTWASSCFLGDGKFFVLDVESALRVRTGDINEDAL